jgi:short-subunit dehydrogenase
MSIKRSNTPRVVVVTGATAGLGRAIVDRFAAAGDHVGLIGRDEQALAALQSDLTARGGRAAYAVADVSKAEAVMAAAEYFERELGPIDIWINNAMVTVFSSVEAIDPAEFRHVTDVTYLGQVHGTMAALKQMRSRRRGQIIQIGSALAFRGIPLQSAYCGAKHAIRGFTNSLRAELIHDRSAIALSIVEMPAMNTPQFDWARVHLRKQPKPAGGSVYQPEACAEAVWRASQTRVREYWVGTSTFMTIVGNILVPAYMDRYLARHAFDGQMRAEDVQPTRADNLYEPVGPLHHARGSFSAISKDRAPILPGQTMRIATVMAGAAVFFLLGMVAGGFWF